MLAISFGSNSLTNGGTVNRNAAASAPSTLMTGVVPGFYTLTMACVDTPYVNWIKCNVPSTGRAGSVVAQYQAPAPNLLVPMRYVVTLWHQPGGRITPPPRAPTSRTAFSLDDFAARYGLVPLSSVGFVVG